MRETLLTASKAKDKGAERGVDNNVLNSFASYSTVPFPFRQHCFFPRCHALAMSHIRAINYNITITVADFQGPESFSRVLFCHADVIFL